MWIIALVVVPVVVDLFIGLVVFAASTYPGIGSGYRRLLLLLGEPFVLLTRRAWLRNYLLLLIAGFVCSGVFWALFAHPFSFLREVEQFSRCLFPVILLAILFYFEDRYRYPSNRQLLHFGALFGTIMGSCLVFSGLTGIGISTYGEWSYGVKSFFIAANDIGLALLLTLVVAFYRLLDEFSIARLFSVTVIALGLFFLASRAATLGAVGVFVIYLFASIFYGRRQVRMHPLYKILLITGLLIVGAIGIKLMADFISKYPYLMAKLESLQEESPRALLESAAEQRLFTREWIFQLFGEGTYSFHKWVETYLNSGKTYTYGKFVEQDLLDFIGGYGWGLGGALLLLPIIVFLKSVYRFFQSPGLLQLTIALGLFLFLGHSFSAGHALNSPTVSTVIILFYRVAFQPQTTVETHV
ncbi:MAG: O-antigen ligase family protein [Salibacteraceae bacterium]